MTTLHVRNWANYQHYKDRQPVWVKLHVSLLDDLEMRKLSLTTRLLWPHILLVAGRYNNSFKDDPKWLGFVLDVDPRTAKKAIAELRKGRWLTAKRASSRASAPDSPRALAKADTASVSTPTALDKGEKQNKPANFTGGLGTESFAHALRLVAALTNKSDNTKTRILDYASKLPPAAFETVREKIEQGNGHIRNDGGYACSELERMVRERQYAA